MTDVEVPPEPWPPWGETIAEESLINGVGSGDSNRSLGNNNINRSYDKPAGSLPKRVGGYLQPFVGPAAERDGRPEGETASLVKSVSISHTDYSQLCLSSLEKLRNLPDKDSRKSNLLLCEGFYEYLTDCERKGFTLTGFDVKKGEFKHVQLGYENQWSPARAKELSKKISLLDSWFILQEDRPVTMITLTSYHEGLTIGSAWFELNKSRDKLLKLIRKYYGDVDYFWVVEPHKSGYVHYHMAVFKDVSNELEWWVKKDGIDWYRGRVNIEDKFRDLWSKKYKTGNHTYGLDFSRKRGDKKIESLKGYLSKYLSKGFLTGEWSIRMLLFNAHLWDTGFRRYGGSKRVSAAMKLPETKNTDIVWLETTYLDLEEVSETVTDTSVWPPKRETCVTKVETERVLWARQYIPDWLDSPLWCNGFEYSWIDGTYYDRWEHCWEPDKSIKLYEWGRRQKGLSGYDPTHGRISGGVK